MKSIYRFLLIALLILVPNLVFAQDTFDFMRIDKSSTQYVDLHDSICHGDDYVKFGFEFIEPEVGIIYDTLWLKDISGNDSVVMLELHVNPTFDKVVVGAICEGDDYNENGFHILAPTVGLHLDTIAFSSVHGCDSVVSLNLTVYPKFMTVFDVEIDSGEDYVENGFEYYNPQIGIYHDSILYNSEHGCDSMVKLNLTVMPLPEVFLEDTVCQGVDYLLNGFVVLHGEAGTVTDTLFLTNMYGGDSTVYLTLTRLPEYETVYTEYICFGESYTEHGFNYINPAVGTYIDTIRYETVLGCDSTEYLNLTVYPVMDSLVVAEICEGENYSDNEFTVIQPSVGIYRDTVLVGDDYGCTMYYLELTVNPKNYTFLMPQICEGSDYVSNGFDIIQPAAGMVYDTLFLTNNYGCDSTVYLALTVNPTFETSFTDAICYGEDYINHGFTILHPAVGVIEESYVLSTINGCDSTIFLTLTVNPVYDTLINAQICYGESYEDNGFSFINPELGVYYDTLSLNSIYGCDSIVSLQLAVNPVFDTLFVDEICHGEDYTLHGFNMIQPTVGTHHETLYLTTVAGCDSLVYLDLTVNPDYRVYFEGELCYGENYIENGFHIIKPAVGVHHDSITFENVHGCDSVMYLTLTVHPVSETWYEAEICHGEDYVGHGFEIINPTAGLHKDTLYFETVHGCDSLICLNLRVWPSFNKQINASICYGENYTLNGFSIINPPVGVTNETLYLHSVHGCDSIVRLALNVLPLFDFGNSEIVGQNDVYVATNLQTGRYKYVIDPIPHCSVYHWEIVGTNDWVVEPQGNICHVVVTTPETYTLRVYAENACSYTEKEFEITGRFYGVDEYEAVDADVYPNPTKDVIMIESEGIVKTTILGLHGQKVKCDNFEGEDKVRVDVGELPRGSYILLIETNSGRVFKNIIIER